MIPVFKIAINIIKKIKAIFQSIIMNKNISFYLIQYQNTCNISLIIIHCISSNFPQHLPYVSKPFIILKNNKKH